MNRFPIVWAPLARISYFEILDYLEQNWTSKEITNFIHRTEKVLELIATHPKVFFVLSGKADL
jgi:hypothetical protein